MNALAAIATGSMLLLGASTPAQASADLFASLCSGCHNDTVHPRGLVYNAAGNAAIITAVNGLGMGAGGTLADHTSIAAYLDTIKPTITMAPVPHDSLGTRIPLRNIKVSASVQNAHLKIIDKIETVTPPTKGTVTYAFANGFLPPSTVTYTPFPGQSGVDTWTYQGKGAGANAGLNTTIRTASVVIAPSTAALNTIGSRGTVTTAAPMYGGFTLSDAGSVIIAVRGPSLQTLGVTQNPLDLPLLRVFDAAGTDLLFATGGAPGITTCPSTNATAVYYATVRGQPLDARDTCSGAVNLPAGVYTFTINPGATDTAGEVLFEVTFNQPSTSGVVLRTIGSRGTVGTASPMYGGFTLAGAATVVIAVRGTSLQTLGITQNPLNEPGLRIFNAAATDLLFASSGAPGIHECPSNSATATYYANVRGQPLDSRDACSPSVNLPAGVYTFTINPGSSDTSGEVLFEVTFNP